MDDIRKQIYNIKLIANTLNVGTKQKDNYKLAVKEAESWIMSGRNYTCIIEWETPAGKKSLELDYYAVQQQRKARIAYRRAMKKNLPKNAYVL